MSFLYLPDFEPVIHIFLLLVFCGVFVLVIWLVHKSIRHRIENGSRYENPCARFCVRYFHCDPEGIAGLADESHLSTDPSQSGNHGRGASFDWRFDPKRYYKSQNDYVFQDPVFYSQAVVQMLEDKRKSTKDGPAMASIENELRATARQGFLQMAAQQINRTLYNREE